MKNRFSHGDLTEFFNVVRPILQNLAMLQRKIKIKIEPMMAVKKSTRYIKFNIAKISAKSKQTVKLKMKAKNTKYKQNSFSKQKGKALKIDGKGKRVRKDSN